jgi:hypothetical protein
MFTDLRTTLDCPATYVDLYSRLASEPSYSIRNYICPVLCSNFKPEQGGTVVSQVVKSGRYSSVSVPGYVYERFPQDQVELSHLTVSNQRQAIAR